MRGPHEAGWVGVAGLWIQVPGRVLFTFRGPDWSDYGPQRGNGGMRAAQFERLTSVPREGAPSVGRSDPSTSVPAAFPLAAFALAVELWDALRDCIRTLMRRAPHVREEPAGRPYG